MPEKVIVDLRIPKAQLSSMKGALTAIENILKNRGVETAIRTLNALPPDVRERALATSPTLARLVDIGRRLP